MEVKEVCINAIPSKKRGKPPLLGEKLDCHLRLQDKTLAMRFRGTPIGTNVVITRILMKHKKTTASSYKVNKDWAKKFYVELGVDNIPKFSCTAMCFSIANN